MNGPELCDVFSQFLNHCELDDSSVLSLSPPDASAAEIKAGIQQTYNETKTRNFFINSLVGTTKTCKPLIANSFFATEMVLLTAIHSPRRRRYHYNGTARLLTTSLLG